MLVEEAGGDRAHKERRLVARDSSGSNKFRFNVGHKSFIQQYDQFYETRLNILSATIDAAISRVWGKDLLEFLSVCL